MTKRRTITALGGFAAFALSLFLLAACAAPGGAVGPTPTPDGATIAQRVQNADIKDATFDMSLSMSQQGQTIDATGKGTLTRNPGRFSFTGNASVAGQQVALDIITDDATKTTYTRIPMLSDKWSKSATTSSSEFGNLDIKNAKLIGTETVNGTVCYHLQGTSSSGSSTTGDYWVSQDKYYPVKMSAKTSDGGQFTMTFTGINSGATIDLPADTQVAAS